MNLPPHDFLSRFLSLALYLLVTSVFRITRNGLFMQKNLRKFIKRPYNSRSYPQKSICKLPFLFCNGLNKSHAYGSAITIYPVKHIISGF